MNSGLALVYWNFEVSLVFSYMLVGSGQMKLLFEAFNLLHCPAYPVK